ncbi:hypothetical protein EGN72_14820 [Pseudorhodobacter sp. E13]|uniref:hypothetical protein n=1 Tax=Pseudorhodobacter sp. E13 TaxID=2487931 RepID=UPI000F8D798A|nr:hypothetical protein [Pseudorhodobacter sp. E13]RUS59217.1 hypothetical protein EGN72_14820 [Pseudorhodobacter sp. E13]
MMHPAVPLTLGALALSACVSSPAPVARGPIVVDGVEYAVSKRPTGAVEVSRIGRPFENWEGAEARRAADQFCVGRAKTSIRDRFQGAAWLIVEGCA